MPGRVPLRAYCCNCTPLAVRAAGVPTHRPEFSARRTCRRALMSGLGGEGAYALVELLPADAERQQQGVLGPAQRLLGRVHDVVDEHQTAALDVDRVGTAA